ncbi:MAG: PilX N-terminal domain-containing pilus assembly protein [Thermodesulfobacteriota bacterium]|nr:PilX N-terminal domain-containing pilus assembly protein [Thermodesulfobacteriota bacterium]
MKQHIAVNEQGFILVWALLLLVVVTLLGTASVTTSIFEEKMAVNEALHNQAFYQADGGTENGLALIKHNINCISGFEDSSLDGDIVFDGKLNFWLENNSTTEISMAADDNRDFYYPAGYATGEPHTNGRINGTLKAVAGSSFIQLAGYEDLAKNIADGGAYLTYDIKVERIGLRNSRTAICLRYRVDNKFATSPAEECVY